MEILKRANSEPPKFRVLRSFYKDGRPLEVGELIEIESMDEKATPTVQFDLVSTNRVVPADIPEVGVYIALVDLALPGKVEKFTCKPLDRIELKAEDALRLMMSRCVIPEDENQWRPFNRRLESKPDEARKRRDAMIEANR